MVNEIRTVCFDSKLQIEAYRFEGIMQKFPNHFHDYYVLGFIENGHRYLLCNNQEHVVKPGDMVIFNPFEPHTCEQIDEKPLDYRCINIKEDIMKKAVLEILGEERPIHFTQNVIYHSELSSCLRELHQLITEDENDFEKEQLFFFLIEQLLRDYSDTVQIPEHRKPSDEIQVVCDYLNENYAQTITLDDLSKITGFSKYHLLRSFTKHKGITPYNYLETIRINRAKTFLEQGITPMEVAAQTGFSDQSHFTNFFKKLIGLTPKQYMKIFLEDAKTVFEN